MGFDKFEWIDLVAGDDRMKVAERFILTNAAIKYVRHGNNLLSVRQTTIAASFAVGVRTVRQSIRRAEEFGYLVVAERRQRGRGHHTPDVYRLEIPASCASIPINSGTDLPEYRHDTTQIAAQPDSLTSDNDTPKGFEEGIEEGAAPQKPDVHRGPFGPRCRAHLYDRQPPRCHACGDARRADENEQRQQAEAQAAIRAKAARAREKCTHCDSEGWIKGEDGTPREPAEKCRKPLQCWPTHTQAASA